MARATASPLTRPVAAHAGVLLLKVQLNALLRCQVSGDPHAAATLVLNVGKAARARVVLPCSRRDQLVHVGLAGEGQRGAVVGRAAQARGGVGGQAPCGLADVCRCGRRRRWGLI
jgi:hypothetical protein